MPTNDQIIKEEIEGKITKLDKAFAIAVLNDETSDKIFGLVETRIMLNQARKDERSILIKAFTEKIENLKTFNAEIEKENSEDYGYVEFYEAKDKMGVIVIKKDLNNLLSQLTQEDTK